MAYDKQTFTVGQVLEAAEQNQIEENIAQVRKAHKGSSAPPQLVAGVCWIDDSSDPWLLKIYDGADWIVLFSIDSTNNQAAAASAVHVDDASGNIVIDSTSKTSLTANVTENTWESYGPTGSGADNIWAALDELPAYTDWIEVRIELLMRNWIAGKGSLAVNARRHGTSAGFGDAVNIAIIGLVSSGSTSIYGNTISQAKIPISSGNLFDIAWGRGFGITSGTTTADLWLTGYGVNRI